jgi:O-succinylbenzoic acid--CoA ligase
MKNIFSSKKCEWIFSAESTKWKTLLKSRVPERADHLWLLSSGTGRANCIKAIAHRKEGFLCAAIAANQHLNSTSSDIWLNVLPVYHVGGLAIYARAKMSGAKVIESKSKSWDASKFVLQAGKAKATLTSLVPTQIYDLVRTNLPAPMSLRAVIVGGGSLEKSIYRKARDLGWPLLPSYGLTECASQVATAPLESLESSEFPLLKPLKHVDLLVNEKRLRISSPALCEWVSTLTQDGRFTLEAAAPTGWFQTEDRVELTPAGLKVLGREGDLVKILGVLINVQDVEHRILGWKEKSGLSGLATVLTAKDARKDHAIILVTDSKDSMLDWVKFKDRCNKELDGPERIAQLYFVDKIPRTALDKIKKVELLNLLGL